MAGDKKKLHDEDEKETVKSPPERAHGPAPTAGGKAPAAPAPEPAPAKGGKKR